MIKKRVSGTFVCITQICKKCEAVNKWESQPFMNSIPAGNILLSSFILYTGSLPEKTLHLLNSFGCSTK